MALPHRSPGYSGDPSSITDILLNSLMANYTTQAQEKISATTSADFATFANMRTVMIYNDGSADIYIAVNGTATTNSFKLSSGNGITILFSTITSVSAITAAGTATVYLWGFK